MEIPGLLYTCIKLRSYPEAIDLISYFTQDIYPIYKDNPFINLIKEEVLYIYIYIYIYRWRN